MKKFALAASIGLALIVASAPAQEPKDAAKPAAPAAKPATAPAPAAAAKPDDLKAKASYCIGLDVGKNIKSQGAVLDLDPESVLKGIKDALSDVKPALTDEEIQATMAAFQKKVLLMREEKAAEAAPPEAKAAAEKNKADGQAYCAANKSKDGVQTTPSGLQYKVIKEGKGASPKSTDTVSVHYRGTLIDGFEFDNSYKRGTPATFAVDEVIPGWTEALQMMKVGSKYQLVIPSELAYRFAGRPDAKIGPNSVLVFEVELMGIE